MSTSTGRQRPPPLHGGGASAGQAHAGNLRTLKDGRAMTEEEFNKIFGVAVDENGKVLDPTRTTTYEKRNLQILRVSQLMAVELS